MLDADDHCKRPQLLLGLAEALMPAGHLNTITHPENFVLQWIAEWGIPAADIVKLREASAIA